MVNSSKHDIRTLNTLPKIGLSSVLLFAFQSFFSIHVCSYQPAENFAINCGSSVDESQYPSNRIWLADMNSTQFVLIEPLNKPPSTSVNAPSDPSVSEVPFTNARISHSEFTYSFQVTEGQKFVRLYFNSAWYPKVERYNALFSVKAGRFTLLKDFNASLTADNDKDSRIFREYCINVDAGQKLNITFKPSPSNRDAYAFINGIEIVSMPTDLYYTKPEDHTEIKFVDQEQYYQITNNSALQTMCRINVGGSQISPEKDAGSMFRYWDVDDKYVERAFPNVSLPAAFGIRPNYTEKVPDYTAPDDLYLTARTYGMGVTINYNVTWNFRVDSLFLYVVRLHFCEFEPNVRKIRDRVFQIFINDVMVDDHADVIAWTGGSLIPIYKEFAIMLYKGRTKEDNLSIKMQPSPSSIQLWDTILNGIEIFKVSDSGTGNLSGPNPDPLSSPTLPLPPPIIPPKTLKKTTIVAMVVGVASSFIVLSVIALLIYRRKSATDNYDKDFRPEKNSLAPAKSSKGHGSSLPTGLCRYFSIDEIRTATNDFDNVLKIGVGGFGIVYKGYIDDNTTPVAIKRLKPGSQQGAVEFKTEIEMLSQLRHLHLVSLIGYCDDGNEMILVYDFMARGTLLEHLYDSDNPPLPWKQRLEICLGAARGLDHLHTGAKYNIIHRDVKSTNILLDQKWVAKVADFGLSKSEPIGMSKSHISTVVKGSLGYLDPEYYKRQRLTQKSDVYSFGVVLLEVLCGRPPLLRTVEKIQTNLVDWVQKCHKNGEIDRAIDPILRGTITPKCLNKFIEMALHCLLDDGDLRPSMNELVWGLEFALQLQETKENTEIGGVEVDNKSQEISSLLLKFENEISEESDVQFTSTNVSINDSKNSKVTVTSTSSEEQALISGSVFSEIKDPRAR